MKSHEFIIKGRNKEDFDQYGINDLQNVDKYEEYRSVKKAEDIANLIKTHCSEMLTAYQQTQIVLLRGIAGHPMADPIITNIRPDRKPVQMEPIAHKKLHLAYQQLGLTATRSNSIFCTTRLGIAGVWGRSYIIFVKNGWSGTVFNKFKQDYSYYDVKDAAQAHIPTQKNKKVVLNKDGEIVSPAGYRLPTATEVARKIKKFGPVIVTPQNLPDVLTQKYEDILITGQSYIGFRIFAGKTSNIANRVFKLLDLRPTNIK